MKIKNIEEFYTGSKNYIEQFDAFAQKHTLVGKSAADHICYKCGSRESFEFLRTMFEKESLYIYQSIISGRPIAIVRFKKPIVCALGEINFLELSDQKQDGSQKDGFDHIEVYPTAMSYDEMVQELEKTETVVKVERPHHTTHDIDTGNGFLFRCTRGPLIEKIKSSEMN